MSEIKIHRTKTGAAALWESGGAGCNTGAAQIMCGPNGEKLTALYVRRSGSLSNGEHALLFLEKNNWIIKASHHRGDFIIRVMRVQEITGDDQASTECVYIFSSGEWTIQPPEYLNDAIIAAKRKATTYHCRSVFFAVEKPKALV